MLTSSGGLEGQGLHPVGRFPTGLFVLKRPCPRSAGPVYRLLGKKNLGTAEFPPIETPLIDGDLAFRQHSGGHTPAPNWPTFLTFADRYFSC
jgi:hypothetical protein